MWLCSSRMRSARTAAWRLPHPSVNSALRVASSFVQFRSAYPCAKLIELSVASSDIPLGVALYRDPCRCDAPTRSGLRKATYGDSRADGTEARLCRSLG